MLTISLQVDSLANAKMLAAMLSRLDFVKDVNLKKASKSKLKPLTAEDWIKPGRPATDEEIEQLCKEMEKEEGGVSTGELKKHVQEWKTKKSA